MTIKIKPIIAASILSLGALLISGTPTYADTLYVALAGSDAIATYPSGGVGSIFADSADGVLFPNGIAFDASGNLYVGSRGDNTIRKLTPGGVSSVFVSTGLNNPASLAFDSLGNLFVSNAFGNSIVKFTPDGVGSVFATSGISDPHGIAFDSAGNLFVANSGIETIVKITPGGDGSLFANTGLSIPNGLAFDGMGNLYVANYASSTILKFSPGGVSSVFASASTPDGLAFDSQGDLYVSDISHNIIQRITPGGASSVFASAGLLNLPSEIAFTTDSGNILPLEKISINAATSGQSVFVEGNYSSANTGQTFTFRSLDVLPGATATLGPNDTLVLTNGPLVIAPGAIFTGNGIIQGDVINHGLVRIPITRLDAVSNFVSPTPIVIPRPDPIPTPVPLPPVLVKPGITIQFGGSGSGSGGLGSGGGSGSFTVAGPVSSGGNMFLPRPEPVPSPIPGNPPIGYDASLEITGSFTQTETGKLRLFIGGDEKGVTYSHLGVGMAVTLSGELQLVLQPDLFGFLPTYGETFDLIDSPAGITIPTSLPLVSFVTQSGASYVPSLTLIPFDSGIANDPDHLFGITETIFTYELVNDGKTLRATYVGPIPEPGMFGLLAAGTAVLLQRRRKGER